MLHLKIISNLRLTPQNLHFIDVWEKAKLSFHSSFWFWNMMENREIEKTTRPTRPKEENESGSKVRETKTGMRLEHCNNPIDDKAFQHRYCEAHSLGCVVSFVIIWRWFPRITMFLQIKLYHLILQSKNRTVNELFCFPNISARVFLFYLDLFCFCPLFKACVTTYF